MLRLICAPFVWLYVIYLSFSGYLRFFYFIFISLAFLIPAWFTWIHGHGRNGRDTVAEALELHNPEILTFWVISLTWFFMPIVRIAYYAIKDKGD